MIAEELEGTWELVSLCDVRNSGVTCQGPLGAEPRGILIYTRSGTVSVHMMSTIGTPRYMGYAGSWRIDGDRIVHRITVTPKHEWTDTDQPRHFALDGDQLTLRGTTRVEGHLQQRELVWRRAI